jgi:hypothetical protein
MGVMTMNREYTLGMLEAYIKVAQQSIHDLENAIVVHGVSIDSTRLDKTSEFYNFLSDYLSDILEDTSKND